MGLPSPQEMYDAGNRTKEYLEALTKVGGLYQLALEAKMAFEASRYAAMAAETIDVAGQVVAIFGPALPVIAQASVFVALGAGYYEAREAARNEETARGFSYGLVCGMLNWSWRITLERFHETNFHTNHFDEGMNSIRANAFNKGLLTGFLAGKALPRDARKKYLKMFRDAAGIEIPSDEQWEDHSDGLNLTRAAQAEHMRAVNVRRHYVQDLAIASRDFIQPE